MESGNKKWTSPETRNLISEFEESPCLWNVFDKDCNNKDMKARALAKIALLLDFSVYEVKRKPHNFRCHCTSELKERRVKECGQGASERYKSQWPYFYVFLAFRFVEAVVNVRDTSGNLVLQPGETARSRVKPTVYCN
jgi:hypothetical protein